MNSLDPSLISFEFQRDLSTKETGKKHNFLTELA